MTDDPMTDDPKFFDNDHPAGGWGSVQSLGRSIAREGVPLKGPRILMHQNKPDGYMCVSCAWAKPGEPRPFEFCEEGAKATTWEITRRRCTPKFFGEHTVTALEEWSDRELEEKGRLTHPLRWNAATDKYAPHSRRPTCMRCSPGCTATTTCPTALTCVTRAPRSDCR
jgi:anaerobic selenocysteine-containing dehydrogenase